MQRITEEEERGECILIEDFEHTLKNLKDGKAAGSDKTGEMLRNANIELKRTLYELKFDIYETGIISEYFITVK